MERDKNNLYGIKLYIMSENQINFLNSLQVHMKENHLSNKILARKLGIKQSELTKFLSGEVKLTLKMMVEIAKIINHKICEMV